MGRQGAFVRRIILNPNILVWSRFSRWMMKVQTILGLKHAEELGFTLVHEHLLTKPPRAICRRDPSILPYEDTVLNSIGKAVEELKEFSKYGKSIVEATPITYGRNARGLARIAKRVPEVNIIAATGFYLAESLSQKYLKMDVNDFSRLMIEEITNGMDGTPYKAGLIKTATGYFRIRQVEERILRAAAKAHRETGAPIQVHTSFGTMSIEIADILKGEGVDPRKVTLLHMDTNLDKWHIVKTLEKEVNISFDRMARLRRYVSDGLKLEYFIKLIDEGFEDQLMMSMDAGRRMYFRSYGGGPGLVYIPKIIVPRMREMGVEEKKIRKIFVENPAKFLSFAP